MNPMGEVHRGDAGTANGGAEPPSVRGSGRQLAATPVTLSAASLWQRKAYSSRKQSGTSALMVWRLQSRAKYGSAIICMWMSSSRSWTTATSNGCKRTSQYYGMPRCGNCIGPSMIAGIVPKACDLYQCVLSGRIMPMPASSFRLREQASASSRPSKMPKRSARTTLLIGTQPSCGNHNSKDHSRGRSATTAQRRIGRLCGCDRGGGSAERKCFGNQRVERPECRRIGTAMN